MRCRSPGQGSGRCCGRRRVVVREPPSGFFSTHRGARRRRCCGRVVGRAERARRPRCRFHPVGDGRVMMLLRSADRPFGRPADAHLGVVQVEVWMVDPPRSRADPFPGRCRCVRGRRSRSRVRQVHLGLPPSAAYLPVEAGCAVYRLSGAGSASGSTLPLMIVTSAGALDVPCRPRYAGSPGGPADVDGPADSLAAAMVGRSPGRVVPGRSGPAPKSLTDRTSWALDRCGDLLESRRRRAPSGSGELAGSWKLTLSRLVFLARAVLLVGMVRRNGLGDGSGSGFHQPGMGSTFGSLENGYMP